MTDVLDFTVNISATESRDTEQNRFFFFLFLLFHLMDVCCLDEEIGQKTTAARAATHPGAVRTLNR